MIESGIEARLSTVDLKKLPGSLVGRRFDGCRPGSILVGGTANFIPSYLEAHARARYRH
jgi:hypothetical protein